jgi:cytochrome c peroxidase
MRKTNLTTLIILLVLVVASCSKEEADPLKRVPVLPSTVYKYDSIGGQVSFDATAGFNIDNQKATLGRVLFYETQLSMNNRVSCGSCHKQAVGFADDVAKSQGFDGKPTKRNSQAILNTGLQSFFFHDLREEFLENMVLMPIADHVEMGLEDKDYMVEKISNTNYYNDLFINAFGDATVSTDRISDALVHFIRSMISVNSKWDVARENNFVNLSPQELRGQDLYFHEFPCSSCHGGNNLMGGASAGENIGLDLWYSDAGTEGIDPFRNVPMNGWFKVPSLRNIEVTGPYMHDGRFKTLEEVVDFYDHGIQRHPQLSFFLRRGTNGGFFRLGESPQDLEQNLLTGVEPLRMFMTTQQKQDLVEFMKTFTDRDFLRDPRFSDPFRGF